MKEPLKEMIGVLKESLFHRTRELLRRPRERERGGWEEGVRGEEGKNLWVER